MAIRVNHNINEIGVVERSCGPIECFIGKTPTRRPCFPQQTADAASVLPQGSLLGHTRSRRIAEVGRTVTTQIGDKYAVAISRQQWRHVVPSANVVGKAMK